MPDIIRLTCPQCGHEFDVQDNGASEAQCAIYKCSTRFLFRGSHAYAGKPRRLSEVMGFEKTDADHDVN